MVRAILFFGLASCGAAQSLISSSVVELPIEGIVSAIDAAGNTYIAGVTNTAGLPTTPGALQPNYGGGTCYSFGFFGGAQPFPCYSIFIAKLDPAGTRILSATYLGGKDRSSVGAIAIGDDGGVYISGAGDTAGLLPLPAAPPGSTPSFVAKLSPGLDKVTYATVVPSVRMAAGRSGIVWLAGPALGQATETVALYRISPSGDLARIRAIDELATVSAIAVDAAGSPVVVGLNHGQPTAPLSVVRFNASGEPTGSAAFGSLLYPVLAAASAPSGDVYVIGNYVTGGYNVPDTPGGFLVHVPADGSPPKILKLGQRLTGVTVTPDGRAFVAGRASAGLPTTADALQRCRSAAGVNTFAAGWDGASAKPFYATYLGSAGYDSGGGISVDSSGLVTVTGPADSPRRGNFITRFRPVDTGQPACIDPLPANLADSKMFPAVDPARVQPAIAPGEFVVFYGSGIGPADEVKSDPKAGRGAPAALAGTRLLVDGQAAPLLSVSENQIIAIVPFGVAGENTVRIQVERDGALAAAAQVPVVAAAPAIFSPNGTEYSTNAVFNADWVVNSAANPAVPGEVITLFVSGAGALDPAPADGAIVSVDSLPTVSVPVQAFISGFGYQAVTFAGQASGEVAGLTQVNVRVAYDFIFHSEMMLELFFANHRTVAQFWVK